MVARNAVYIHLTTLNIRGLQIWECAAAPLALNAAGHCEGERGGVLRTYKKQFRDEGKGECVSEWPKSVVLSLSLSLSLSYSFALSHITSHRLVGTHRRLRRRRDDRYDDDYDDAREIPELAFCHWYLTVW